MWLNTSQVIQILFINVNLKYQKIGCTDQKWQFTAYFFTFCYVMYACISYIVLSSSNFWVSAFPGGGSRCAHSDLQYFFSVPYPRLCLFTILEVYRQSLGLRGLVGLTCTHSYVMHSVNGTIARFEYHDIR